jgi:cell division protein FtsI/penicillin-binding protein 2
MTPATHQRSSSIDARVEAAAAHALSAVAQPADLIAISASTGEILAYLSTGGLAPDDALVGRYPAGSTFKVATAADLIEHGRGPESATRCPASLLVEGRTITTFDGLAHRIASVADAFAQSCNTAFAALGLTLPGTSLAKVAAQFGLGVQPDVGRPAFGGTVAAPTSSYDRAETASDGGSTLVSPLALATMAAAIDAGALHMPRLDVPSDGTGPGLPLPFAVADGLRTMMAAVVDGGTASGQGLPPLTHAKTGTAVFANATPPRPVYAWIIGYRADIAFAVLVVGGSAGGTAAGPIAASFLRSIG